MPSTIRGSDNFDTAGGNAVKAWVNFNGTETVAIRASYNVTSITDNGTGNYRINLTNALADTNYALIAGASGESGVSFNSLSGPLASDADYTTTSAVLVTARASAPATSVDVARITVAIFR